MTDEKTMRGDNDSPEKIEIEIEHAGKGPLPVDPDPVLKAEDFSGEPATDEESTAVEVETPNQRIRELEDKLLRTAADFDNYKKRTARQFEEMANAATDRLMGEFLEIIDNFERAREHAREDASLESLLKGLELIHGQMVALLAKYNIEPIEALGKPFDANLHDALFQVDSDEYAEGIVAQEVARGYKQGNRVLRHSRVAVSKGKK
ncbi:nucleotide exchange factor GrpE [candidate division GN15 bacterium]|uniref:Protein GrpE n=1 Tax=candidate division GN15 bacterium TaxID=2072418 RepID=A0A855X724_9BACT|nr:MAG: nucleotide exchange factor GrpE [candidate division GN15 bacterium]